MRSSNEHIAGLEDASYRELRLLEEVDGRPDVSQRQLARNLGVALGVANLLVRTMARKGYIKMTHLSWRRWVYVVTPRGMARKVQLTLSYVDRFIGHYRRVRTILYDDLSGLALNKESRVAIVGTDELAELAYLALRDIGVDDIDIFSRRPERPTFLGIPVREIGEIDAESYASVVLAVSGTDAVEDCRGQLLGAGLPTCRLVELMGPRAGVPAGSGRPGIDSR
jgi:DNA-binding MarR family transcriptional regulator